MRQGHGLAGAEVQPGIVVRVARQPREQVVQRAERKAIDAMGDAENVLSCLEIDDHVVTAAAGENEAVVAGSALEGLVAVPGKEQVVARIPLQQLRTGTAEERVV